MADRTPAKRQKVHHPSGLLNMAASRVITQRQLSNGNWQSKYSINYREVASATHKDKEESLRMVQEDFPGIKVKVETLTDKEL